MHQVSMEQQPDCQRRRTQATSGLVSPRVEAKASSCQRDDDSQGGEREIQMQYLPEDIWHHIHSLMPMREAARAACASHSFLRSWRCHPNLTFCGTTLGMNKKAFDNDEIARDFSSKVDQILRNHSGIGVKKLLIDLRGYYTSEVFSHLDSWLSTAVTPGIEDLTVRLQTRRGYNFPCSLLSNGSGDSIRCLQLWGCCLRPTAELPWLKSLTNVQFDGVCCSGDELGCLLSNSFVLERLVIRYCDQIVSLKIPCMLQQLSYLYVLGCGRLQVIDSKAPNISSFFYGGDRVQAQLLLGETLKMEYIHLIFSGALHYAFLELPSSMPNLKIANIYSRREMANTPMLRTRFLHLKMLSIALTSQTYDYFSLVSFLDACPSLETLVLDASQDKMEHVSVFADPSDLRKMQGQQHHKMKRVKIYGFTSAKCLVELTCHIVESLTSLEVLTLESYQSSLMCSVPAHKRRKCSPLSIDVLREAQRGLLAIRTYIEPKVPSMVKLRVIEPCRRCHGVVEL